MAPGMDNDTSAATGPDSAGYQVDDLVIDPGQRRVTRAGRDIPLPHLSFELLMTLARAAPDVVTFDQLTERVWPGLVITPETISQRVKLVRDALGDDPHAPRYIAGVRGSGYRMAAPVRPVRDRRRVSAGAPAAELPYWIRTPESGSAGDSTPSPSASQAADADAPAPGAPVTELRRVLSPRRAPGWLGGILLIAALLAVPWAIRHYQGVPKHAEAPATVVVQPPRTIAVLPLLDTSPAGGNAYLGDGLAQELSVRLARIRGVRVAARTSAFAFRDRHADARTIAQTLGVRHILEGSVLREDDHLRVTAQLVDSASGYTVWSQTYNRKWQDLLAIEDDLVRSIMGALQVVLSGDVAQRLTQAPTTHLAAFDSYLAGLSKMHGPAEPAQLDEAEESFREALAVDPGFARAYAGLCERYSMGYSATRDASFASKAEASCDRALALDPSLREVSAALGRLYLLSGRSDQAVATFHKVIEADPGDADGYIGLAKAFEGQRRGAEAERAYLRAIDVDPTYWSAHTALGNFLFRQGRTAEAIVQHRRVTELTPASPLAFNNLGAAMEMTGDLQGAAIAFERSLALEPTRSAYSNSGTVYYFLGRYPDAASMFSRATELAPEDHRVWGNLADALWQQDPARTRAQGDYRHAIALAQRSLEVNPKDAVSWAQLAHYNSRLGDTEQARRYAVRALELGSDEVFVHYYAALVALQSGDSASALDALGRAVGLGYPPQLLRAAPDFARLRPDARFQSLLTQAQAKRPPVSLR
jgi:TolB-like protein/tetratricopeptide (TPR) repeat protein/DNA-binding winged helix-turn-helix (wHTH) protein